MAMSAIILTAGRRLCRNAICLALAAALSLVAAQAAPGEPKDDVLGRSTWNPLNRDSAGHFRVADPAHVSDTQAEAAYRALAPELAERYRLSGIEAAARYQEWTRYNTSSYRSVSHGKRYLNNYANRAAGAYGRYEEAGVLPQGAVLAKDSFSIAKDGLLSPGPLFLMEKMVPGFNPESGDWRYTMILPDGSVLGRTRGENARNVAFCVSCHADAGQGRDHLFFPRKGYRRAVAGQAK